MNTIVVVRKERLVRKPLKERLIINEGLDFGTSDHSRQSPIDRDIGIPQPQGNKQQMDLEQQSEKPHERIHAWSDTYRSEWGGRLELHRAILVRDSECLV